MDGVLMMQRKMPTVSQLAREAPLGMTGCCAFDDARTAIDLWWACRITLDCIEEGEEEANYWKSRSVSALRRFVAKWEWIIK